MAALVLPTSTSANDLDWAALARHLSASLAPYAVPLFMRVLSTPPLTETLKHVKTALREEGADPTTAAARPSGSQTRDPVFVLSGGGARPAGDGGPTYVPLTVERWNALLGGGSGGQPRL